MLGWKRPPRRPVYHETTIRIRDRSEEHHKRRRSPLGEGGRVGEDVAARRRVKYVRDRCADKPVSLQPNRPRWAARPHPPRSPRFRRVAGWCRPDDSDGLADHGFETTRGTSPPRAQELLTTADTRACRRGRRFAACSSRTSFHARQELRTPRLGNSGTGPSCEPGRAAVRQSARGSPR